MTQQNEFMLIKPVDTPIVFKVLDRTKLQNVDYLRAFVDEFASHQRALFDLKDAVNELVCEIGNHYQDERGRNFGLLYQLEWRVDFYQMFSDSGQHSEGVFVTFTAISRAADHPKLEAFIRAKVEESRDTEHPLHEKDFGAGVAACMGFWLTRGGNALTARRVNLVELLEAGPPYFDRHKRMSPRWGELMVRHFYQSINENKEQVVKVVNEQATPPEGVKYYTRATLADFLREHVAKDELDAVAKFIDTQTAEWSRHLVMTTHKKQTEQTPRYSFEPGPNIATLTLERGDLDAGERAPKLQMIFTDLGPEQGLAISPRTAGGMVVSRMVDTFAQIVRELQAGQSVRFNDLTQIVGFVDGCADEQTTVIGFRQELGNPLQALLEAGVPDPEVHFRMRKVDSHIEVETFGTGSEGEDDDLLKFFILDDVGQNGQMMLSMSAETRMESMKQAAAQQERALSPEMKMAWNEVRLIEPTRDEDVGIGVALPENISGENALDVIIHAQPIRALKRLKVIGSDEYMLEHFIERLMVSNISMRDKKALVAFRHYILDGEGLANVDEWSFEAGLKTGDDRTFDTILRGDNNAFIIIYNDSISQVIYQCKVDVE